MYSAFSLIAIYSEQSRTDRKIISGNGQFMTVQALPIYMAQVMYNQHEARRTMLNYGTLDNNTGHGRYVLTSPKFQCCFACPYIIIHLLHYILVPIYTTNSSINPGGRFRFTTFI